MIKVVNYHKWTLGGENIMRPGALGNPFDSKALGISRNESITKFKQLLEDNVLSKTGMYDELMRLANFHAANEQVVLICACKPKKCHGDIIKNWILNEVANRS